MKKPDVIKYFGNSKKVAEALGISQAAISQWPPLIPEKPAHRLALLTKGRVSNGMRLNFVVADYDDASRRERSVNEDTPLKKPTLKRKKTKDADVSDHYYVTHIQQPIIRTNRSDFITKNLFSVETGIKNGTVTSWQKRYWKRGDHYAVVGRTTLIHRERVERWLRNHFDPEVAGKKRDGNASLRIDDQEELL